MTDSGEPPTSINPYSVLSISKVASSDEIKKAYKTLALRLHPDKVPFSERSIAHTKFQELALAYAILSDPRRKRRYDTTGSTVESLDIEDDVFDWTSFFRAQYTDLVTVDKINDLKSKYQGSEEETRDVLAAYTAAKGSMKGVYERVMMSNMLVDEDRFREVINGAISKGLVEGFPAYQDETKRQKGRRIKRALKEQGDAEEHANALGIRDKVFGSNMKEGKEGACSAKKSVDASQRELAALVQQRVKGRMESFLESLEDKYVGKSKKRGRGKDEAVVFDKPPEEAFERMAKKAKKELLEIDDHTQPISAEAAKSGKKRSAKVVEDETPEDDVNATPKKKRKRGHRVS